MNDPETSSASILSPHRDAIAGLCKVGNQFWNRGWSLGTSSNYSVVVAREPLQLLITASGKDKGHLGENDFVLVDQEGKPNPSGQPKSSAETLLHCSAAKVCGAGAVLHTHSIWATTLSEHFATHHGILIQGYEMLKGLEGIQSHDSIVWLPIFENTQDIPALQREVEAFLANPNSPRCWGYLIRKHGMYTWGSNLAEAVRHVEIIEFLLECIGRGMDLP